MIDPTFTGAGRIVPALLVPRDIAEAWHLPMARLAALELIVLVATHVFCGEAASERFAPA